MAFTSTSYPLSAFHFKVSIGVALGLTDTSFQEVSGIGSKMETEPYNEGGENRFVHQLPTKVDHPKLVLSRGIAPLTSPLVIWCKATLEADFLIPIVPSPVLVSLLNDKGLPVRSWSFDNCFPVNWEVEGLKSTKNEVAIEKIELNYSTSMRVI